MLTPKEVGKMIGVSKVTVIKYIHQGKIHAIRIGKSFKIEEQEAERIKKEGTG